MEKAELEEPGSKSKQLKANRKCSRCVCDVSYLRQSVFLPETNPESRSLCLPVEEISVSLHPEGHIKVTSHLRLIFTVLTLSFTFITRQ